MTLALVVDVESTGFYRSTLPPTDPSQPWIVQLAWAMVADGRIVEASSMLVNPPVPIPPQSTAIHGITDEMVNAHGYATAAALDAFYSKLAQVEAFVAHNSDFDAPILASCASRLGLDYIAAELRSKRDAGNLRCTMRENEHVVRAKSHGGRSKFPKLSETYQHYFGRDFHGAHDALYDVLACAEVWIAMERRNQQDADDAHEDGKCEGPRGCDRCSKETSAREDRDDARRSDNAMAEKAKGE